MKDPKPIKRHIDIQPLSRDHHFGLLFCWKIRTGLNIGISMERMERYKEWFYSKFLIPHFLIEEKYLFPVLATNHSGIQQAMKEHQKLQLLFLSKKNTNKVLRQIEKSLTEHIRFEERCLFNEIQEKASDVELKTIFKKHTEIIFEDDWTDKFWIKKHQ